MALQEQQADVLFLDIQMPGMNGFGVIEQIGFRTCRDRLHHGAQ